MSFQGNAPLVSPSELTYFPILANTGFNWTVSSGLLQVNDSDGGGFGTVFLVDASGAETDNVYVGVAVGNVTGISGILRVAPGFVLDATHYCTVSPIGGAGGTLVGIEVIINNGGTQQTINQSFSPPIPYSETGTFLTYYASISGTVISSYAIAQSTGLITFLASYDVSAIVSAATLQTWSAGIYLDCTGPAVNVSMKELAWGPNSDLLPVIVPNVVGLDQSTASSDLTAAGLTTGTLSSIPNPATIGTVLAQNPVAFSSVIHGTGVNLTLSSGSPPTTVPNLFNTSVAVVAPGLLAAADLNLGTVTYATSGTIIVGNIISQNPAAGTTVGEDSSVSVVVSSGLPALTVPDLFGLTQDQAVTLLLSLGLVPGAIGSAPSKFVPPNQVQTQNPSAGAPVAVGTIVSFVLSLGIPLAGTLFDFEATVISQYANSPTILQLCNNLNQYIDQSANFANFYNFVWNVDTAVGFGLDIWGKIVGVSRLLQIPNLTPYVGFYIAGESQPTQDWTPAGSSQPPYNNPPVGGAFYTGHNATQAYLLDDASYRQLILAKAFANICTTTAPAINQILQNLYGPGTAWVLNTGPMAISYNLTFTPTAIQLAILEQSGVIPTPPGVSVTINTNV